MPPSARVLAVVWRGSSLLLVEAAKLAICKANCLEFFNVASEIRQLAILQLPRHALCSCHGELVLAGGWELTRAEGNSDIAAGMYCGVSRSFRCL